MLWKRIILNKGKEMQIPDDPVIRDLIDEFVDTWIIDLDQQYSTLIDSKNDTDLYRLAHTLKGSCFQFGLNEIAELGIELMGHAKQKDWEKCAGYETPLKNGFKDVKKFIQENVN